MEEQKTFNFLFLISVVLLVLVGVGMTYFFMHKPAVSQSVTNTYQPITGTAQPPTQASNLATPSTPATSAMLDQNSLTSTSSTPTITGTFANTTDLEVLITKSDPPTEALLSNTVPDMVWDDRSDHGGGVILKESPSGNFSDSVTTPLPDGIYNVGIYIVTYYYPETDANLARDYRQLLTSGTLTIQSNN